MTSSPSPSSCRRPGAVKAILLFTSFCSMLNETSINVALSRLMAVFSVPVTTVQWLVTGFMLVMAVVVPLTAYLIGRFSSRQLYFSSLTLLILGSLAAGFAPSFVVLLLGRLVQAVGTCILMTFTVTTVMQLTPAHQRGGAMGLIGLVTLFAPAVAPGVGGFVLQTFCWQCLFLGTLPFFVVMLFVAGFFLENVSEPAPGDLDLWSVGLSVLGFGGVILGLGGLGSLDTQPLWVWIPGAVGLVALAGFVARQWMVRVPLLDLAVFRYRQFALGMIFVFVSILSVFGITMLTPMALGQLWGLGAAAAGLAMLPGGLLNGITAPVFGKLYDQWGPRRLVTAGVIVMILGLGGLALLPPLAPVGAYIGLHIAFLLGVSAVMTVNQANGLNALPPRLFPHGTAVLSTLMQLGGGVGTALYVSVLASGQNHGPEAAFHGTFAWGALLLVLPLVASFFLKKSVHPSV